VGVQGGFGVSQDLVVDAVGLGARRDGVTEQ